MRIILVLLFLSIIDFGCYTYTYSGEDNVQVKDTLTYSDPCLDKQLIRLEQKDSLTADELKAYVELKKLCQEKKSEERLNRTTELAETTAKNFNIYIILLIIGAVASIIYFLTI